jgi:tetratricopeptide (TPR) repeat protein
MSVEIVSLQCPVCGAPFAPTDEKCSYCGSILVLRTDHPKINPSTLNRQVVDKHIAGYRQDLRRDPTDSTAHYGLGVAYFNLGLTDDSVRELEEAARSMPENANIQSQLAVVLKQALDEGRPGAAAKLRDRIEYTLRLDPDNYDALLLKAETDPNLSDLESLELLEKAYTAHPGRTSARLVAALTHVARSNRNRGTDTELDLLRRASSIDGKNGGKALYNAVLQRAQKLSNSDPAADVREPMRAAKALELWDELFELDTTRARIELGQYLLSGQDWSKTELKRLRALIENPAAAVGESRSSGSPSLSTTDSVGIGQYLKAIAVGLLKALGILIAIFILFALVSNIDGVSAIVAVAFGLMLLVLPVLMPIKEVRKLQRSARGTASTGPTSSTPFVHATPVSSERQHYNEMLEMLKSAFAARWNRQSVERIKFDPSRSGVRGERERQKIFLASLSK